MSIRIGTFNVENLFNRPRAMNQKTWAQGQPMLDAANELNDLFQQDVYSTSDKKKMLALLKEWDLLSARPKSEYLELRKTRGQLFRIPKSGSPEIVANGRADWVGWVDLKTEPIEDEAITNTARVVAEVNADVLVVVEVENRITLQQFHDAFVAPEMTKLGYQPYGYNMVIDGNDRRGIDVGILSRYPISLMRSHITDKKDGEKVFARDCPEYYVGVEPGGADLAVLPNHFTSKGSDFKGARRVLQSGRAKEIYESIRADHEHVVVAGDFNDFPGSGNLDALLKNSDLTDAMALPAYSGEYPGTYQRATERDKIDYLLLSPALKDKVTKVDVERRGFYAPTKWQSFENINKETKDRFQASDHHCLWADIDL